MAHSNETENLKLPLFSGGDVWDEGDFNDAFNSLEDKLIHKRGSWTPAVKCSVSTGAITYNSRNARYYRVGSLVAVQLYINCYGLSNCSGNVYIDNLPYSSGISSGNNLQVPVLPIGDSGGAGILIGRLDGDKLYLRKKIAGSDVGALTAADHDWLIASASFIYII